MKILLLAPDALETLERTEGPWPHAAESLACSWETMTRNEKPVGPMLPEQKVMLGAVLDGRLSLASAGIHATS
jgi:hypothetical protein